MQRLLSIIGLQAYAVLLALYQGLSSVHTDEAKYLLDIPYPHPPLMRGIIHATEGMVYQEMFWRVLLATVLVQSVWLVARMANKMSTEKRLTLCGMWIFSSAVLFQAGSIMMAPITALQGLCFVWLLFADTPRKYAGWIALLWLVSLFTAYQAILYGPVALAVLWRMRVPLQTILLALGVPVALVILYIATNPLAAASFMHAGGQHASLPFIDTVQIVGSTWLWSGSVAFSIIGVISILISSRRALLGSFVLICAFLMVSFRPYYAVLFLPLFAGGVVAYPTILKRSATLLAFHIVMTVWIFAHTSLAFYPAPSRTVMQQVNAIDREGEVLINGSFGHDWQYESRSPVLRFTPSLLSKAKAVVCLEPCINIRGYGFYQIENIAVETWVRKK